MTTFDEYPFCRLWGPLRFRWAPERREGKRSVYLSSLPDAPFWSVVNQKPDDTQRWFHFIGPDYRVIVLTDSSQKEQTHQVVPVRLRILGNRERAEGDYALMLMKYGSAA